MDNKLDFTTAAFGGFEKQEVIDRISNLEEENMLIKLRFEERIKEQEADIKTLGDSLIAANKLRSQLEERLRETSVKLSEKENQLQEALLKEAESRKEIERLSHAQTAGDGAEKAQQERILAEIKLEREQLEQQKEEMGRTTSQIGQVMVNVHLEAEEILTKAREERDRILQDAEKQAEEMLAKLNEETIEQKRIRLAQLDEEMAKSKSDMLDNISSANSYIAEVVGYVNRSSAMAQEILSGVGEVHNQFNEFSAVLKKSLDGISSNLPGYTSKQPEEPSLAPKEEKAETTEPVVEDKSTEEPRVVEKTLEQTAKQPYKAEKLVVAEDRPQASEENSADMTETEDEEVISVIIKNSAGKMKEKPDQLAENKESDYIEKSIALNAPIE